MSEQPRIDPPPTSTREQGMSPHLRTPVVGTVASGGDGGDDRVASGQRPAGFAVVVAGSDLVQPADVPTLIADTIHRALARPEPLSPDDVAAVDRANRDFSKARS